MTFIQILSLQTTWQSWLNLKAHIIKYSGESKTNFLNFIQRLFYPLLLVHQVSVKWRKTDLQRCRWQINRWSYFPNKDKFNVRISSFANIKPKSCFSLFFIFNISVNWISEFLAFFTVFRQLLIVIIIITIITINNTDNDNNNNNHNNYNNNLLQHHHIRHHFLHWKHI